MRTGFKSSTNLFVVVQLIGLVSMFTWQAAPRAVASPIWGTAIVALFPGNFLSAILIDKLFWQSQLSQTAMVAAEIPLLIAINAALWFGLNRTAQWLFRQRFH
jgi:hypothetical protein